MAVSKDLLCKEEGSMLEAKFSGRFPIEINNGKVMIDRDPRIFRQMINYVRNNNSIPKFKNKDDAELFRLELEYWSLKPAYSLVQECIDDLQLIFNKQPKVLPSKCIMKWKELGPLNLRHLYETDQIKIDYDIDIF